MGHKIDNYRTIISNKDQNLKVHRHSSHAKVSITNTGSEVPASELENIFESFISIGKKEGTGLGLAIARKFVTLHGGKIWCESKNQSVTFNLLKL